MKKKYWISYVLFSITSCLDVIFNFKYSDNIFSDIFRLILSVTLLGVVLVILLFIISFIILSIREEFFNKGKRGIEDSDIGKLLFFLMVISIPINIILFVTTDTTLNSIRYFIQNFIQTLFGYE